MDSAASALVVAILAAQSSQPAGPIESVEVRSGDGLELGLASDGAIVRVEAPAWRFELARHEGGVVVTDVTNLLAPIAGEAQLAPNPSFESDANGDAIPDGWWFVDFWGSGGSATWDPAVADDGARSIRLDGAGGEAIETLLPAARGEELLIQAARLGAPTVRVLAFWYDASWRYLGSLLGDGEDPAAAFAPFGRIVRAPPQAAWVIVGFQKLAAGSLWIDSARVVAPDRSVRGRLDGFVQGDPARRLARQITTLDAMELDAVATWHGGPRSIGGHVELIDRTAGERAIDVEIVVPLALDRAWFESTPRGGETLRRVNQWSEFQRVEAAQSGLPFADGRHSIWPLAAVAEPARAAALALCMPPGDPRPFTLSARTEPGGGLVLSIPIGISQAARRARGRASLSFELAAVDPEQPFRSGLDRLARIHPELAERRFGAGGTWIPFTDPATIPNVADFGFAVHEGDNSVDGDDALGIASFVYVEPWDYWLDLGDYGSEPSYADALARLADQQAGGAGYSPAQVALARATDVGGHHDGAGDFLHSILNRPWIPGSGWSCLLSLSPESGLTDPGGRGWDAPFHVFQSFIDASYSSWSAAGAALDGTYLDSLTTYFGLEIDRRSSQWAEIETPLTWDRATRAPALWPPSQVAAVARSHALRERAAGRFLMGNALWPQVRAAAPWFDYLGVESDWRAGPPPDSTLLFWRAAAYRRPFCILQNTDFTLFDHAAMQSYMERCLFYGLFASCFSADASSHPYFEDPALYERDRDLFLKYVPLARDLDSAGWEPLTHATTDRPDVVLVERFGRVTPTSLPRFTVLNDATGSRSYSLTIEKAPLGLGTITSCTDAITGTALSFTQDSAVVIVTDRLPACGIRMLLVN